MSEAINQTNFSVGDNSALPILMANGNFEIAPYDHVINFEDLSHFTKLKLSAAQKIHISAFIQNALPVVATGMTTNAYVVKFPEGLQHTLTKLQQGGVSSKIQENGRFVGDR